MTSDSHNLEEPPRPTCQGSEIKDNITIILSEHARSARIDIAGVNCRADGAQLPSNSPCEDRFNRAKKITLWDNKEWIAATVFDGHNGWQTAEYLQKELLTHVQRSLRELKPESRSEPDIQLAVKKAFIDLDQSIIKNYIDNGENIHLALEEKVRYMQIAMSGSCALLSLYDPTTSQLYTACTGDSRAILGRKNLNGTWAVEALSKDQRGDHEEEMTRIQEEHPSEEDVTKDGKVLGLACTRAFGDSQWKLPYEVQFELGKRFCSHGPMDKCKTPPYLTAEPVITVVKITEPSFTILATDGFWDKCENEEALDLVVKWITGNCQPREEAKYAPGFDYLERWNGFDTRYLEERATLEDRDNVAVHLLRNACGGDHREFLAGNLAFQPPYSRLVRDDITIQVIFFNLFE